MRGKMRTVSWVGLFLMIVGGSGAGHGAWILAKAGLAQVLLESAWHQAERGAGQPAPWPWADTWPVARLQAKGVDLIVLSGASGAVLAFGPGHLHGTALPGARGHSVIAGHRDTHFEFLRGLTIGEELAVSTPDGRRISYRVERVWIADESDPSVFDSGPGESLTLLTCFPFDALEPGGSLRYLVRARRESRDPDADPPDRSEDRDGMNHRLAQFSR